MNPVVRGDISVSAFLDSVGGYRHKERRDKLLDLLDIDLDWHMHTISDGERRRVQLCFGLMAPWDVLLLDEVCLEFSSRNLSQRSCRLLLIWMSLSVTTLSDFSNMIVKRETLPFSASLFILSFSQPINHISRCYPYFRWPE